jgi:DNA-binding protein YbaB
MCSPCTGTDAGFVDDAAEASCVVGEGAAADGTVEVTVDARCMVTEIVIDETYLEEFELAELGGHIVGAARAAGQEVGRQAAALGAPLSERRKAISRSPGWSMCRNSQKSFRT